jgi:glycosyltransferase involved in cell wall biosynthesis
MSFDGLRLMLVGPLPPPAGGMANQTRQLADKLALEGAKVELVQTNAPYRPAWLGSMPGIRAIARLLPYLTALWRAAARNDVMHVMANSGWSWHLFAAPAIWIGWLRACPVVVNYRGGEAEPFLMKHAALVRLTMARAALLVVPSGFLQGVFGRFGMTATIVPNAVDVERFSPTLPRPCGTAPHLVVTRNLEAIYDNETAIRALALFRTQFTGAHLTIAGEGPERQRLEALALELGLRESIVFAGRLDRDGVVALYGSADVMINPSRVDNTPNSVLEALACGVPVVSTNVGGVPFLVEDDRTALLVPPGDPQAMCDALIRLFTTDGLIHRLHEAGLAHVAQFSWPAVRRRLADTYCIVLPATDRRPDRR